MRSVRRRLLLLLTVGFGGLVVGGAFAFAAVARSGIVDEFDAGLLTRARAIEALTENEKGRIELDYTPATMPDFERAEKPDYFQIWLDDGLPLHRSKQLKGDLPRAATPSSTPRFADVTLADGRKGRTVETSFVPHETATTGKADDPSDAEDLGSARGRRGILLVVARDREGLDGRIGGITTRILGLGAIAALLGAALVRFIVASGLRPIADVAAQVERIAGDRAGERVVTASAPAEVAGVAVQVNSLLDRLEAALERERRFTGNVAHELRTPIAELRSLATVGARWPDDRDAVVDYFGDVDDVAGRMDRLVADLLLLARCQAGAEPVATTDVPLAEAIQASWDRMAAGAAGRSLSFECDVSPDLVVATDAGKLGIVVENLLGNAVAYALPDTAIRCRGRSRGGRLELVVENDAVPLGAAELARVGEPFWRAERARSSREHAGLGTSLVKALAGLLGLRVSFEQDAAGTFRARVEGPPQSASSLRAKRSAPLSPTPVPPTAPGDRS